MKVSSKIVNGFSQDAIGATVNAIQENPAIAHFELRAQNAWMGAAHTRSYVQGFYGACQEDTSRTEPFIYDHDEPPVLMGHNKGANPGEILLFGLLSCMTTAMVILAAARGIEVEAVSSKIEGDINLQGFMGLDASIKKEFSQIRVTFDIEGVDEETKMELIALAKQSPVLNSLTNPVDVQVDLA